MQSHDRCENLVQLFIGLLFPREINVLNPQFQIPRKFLDTSAEKEEYCPLSATSGPHAHPLDSFSAQSIDILLKLNISKVVGRVRASRIDDVFEIGALFGYGANLFLHNIREDFIFGAGCDDELG